ncbi:TRP-domain-containing protein [Daldinia caldariorum]|uniref:TRP-domain-containing protein n=1 Tax=Daldinia caldariorum TaxID=326644 RepID=UPI002008C3CD|nr:TRP-domain-containing protein [Daldinia caldariorum]KAI1470275.1 TRP-domain-containing protein [Daldinia caldariorum]
MATSNSRWNFRRAAVWATAFASGVMGSDVLVTSGFNNCQTNSGIRVQKVDISFNNADKVVVFDVAGSSNQERNITASLSVTAYGKDIYSKNFNPCSTDTFIETLCPVPQGVFTAKGDHAIPAAYANVIPAVAFQVPDISAEATLKLMSLDGTEEIGCIQAQITNGKTTAVSAVSYVAAGVAGAALLMGGVGAIGAAGGGAGAAGGAAGGGTMSPSFTEMVGIFQGFAMNGMMSVQTPQIYRSFTKNFAFSTGIIPWRQMQISIDNFRAMTGGNLTRDSVEFLQQATLVYPDGSTSSGKGSLFGRSVADAAHLAVRDASSTDTDIATSTEATIRAAVSGIQGYAQQLSVPQSNTFMTVLLIVAIIVAVIVVGILLVKVILEAWSLYGHFPESLTGFRKHYWVSIARAITSLILLLYSIWVLYCVFQFTHGDSWAAQLLAALTLLLFTAVLAFFSWRIWSVAHKLKSIEGDASGLYEKKEHWMKYSLFYESYRKDYWWIFVPVIGYMFAKGCVLAATDGNGMAQSICLLIVEGSMLALLAWSRPFERKSGNIINISIAVVRVLSIVCVLVFVEEFGIAQTTQTVAGVVLIGLQSALAGALAILIAWNAIIALCKQNPHRKRRKEMEQYQRDMDNLTPLDARNSLLLGRMKSNDTRFTITYTNSVTDTKQPLDRRSPSPDPFMGIAVEQSDTYSPLNLSYNTRPLTPSAPVRGSDLNAAPNVGGGQGNDQKMNSEYRGPTVY